VACREEGEARGAAASPNSGDCCLNLRFRWQQQPAVRVQPGVEEDKSSEGAARSDSAEETEACLLVLFSNFESLINGGKSKN
jgi:hypothetical protein